MTTSRFVRRNFLKGFGASLAAAPFVPLPADADPSDYPKRLLFFITPNGTVMDDLWPGASFDLTQSSILSPLAAFSDRLIVMRHLDNNASMSGTVPQDHLPDNVTLLTGRQCIISGNYAVTPGSVSVDQFVAAELQPDTRFSSLVLGAHTNYKAENIVSATGTSEPVMAQHDPRAAFDDLFGELDLDVSAQQRLRARRGSVLDTVSTELQALECELTGSHREKLQRHLDAVVALEGSLDATGGAACTVPTQEQINDIASEGDYHRVVKQQILNMSHALTCDLTRIGVLFLYGNKIGHPDLSIYGSHHGISHGSEGVSADENTRRGWLVQIENWYAQQMASLMAELDAIPEGDGSVLDHTTIVWMHEQSNAATHQRSDMPIVIGGGLSGSFEMGRRIDAGGKAHNQLLASLAKAMGVDVTGFGDTSLTNANGLLTELYG